MKADAETLTAKLAALYSDEREALVDFLLALIEFDDRRLWADRGFNGLHPYLCVELRMPNGTASSRRTAIALLRKFPEVEAPLRDGSLVLAAIPHLLDVLTKENFSEVLPRFFGCSGREAEAVAVSLRPVEDPPTHDVVTSLPTPASALPTQQIPCPRSSSVEVAAPSAAPIAPTPREEVVPLSADQRRLHVNVPTRGIDLLEALKDDFPGQTSGDLIVAALELLKEKADRRRGLVKKPRPAKESQESTHSRDFPAAERRIIWTRDKGKCQWPLKSGGICGATRYVQVDHVVASALGGPSTASNGRLLCRFHNQQAAFEAFGEDWMRQFTRDGYLPKPTSD